MTLSLIIVFAFGLLVLFVSIYGYRVSAKTAEDYLLAGRTLGVIVMLFFIMFGVLSVWTILFFPGSMYVQGPGFSFFGWGVTVGYAAMLIFLGPRLATVARINRCFSPVEIVGERYESKFIRVSLAIILVGFLIPFIGVQPIATGLAMEVALGIPVIFGTLFIVALMLVIVLVGGMRTVAWVNVLLGTVFIVALFGSFFWVVRVALPGGLPEAVAVLAQNNPEQLGIPGPLGMYIPAMVIATFVGGFATITHPHIMLSIMGARDIKVFKWLAVLFVIMAGAIYFVVTVFGSLVAPAVLPGLTGRAADTVLQILVTGALPEWMSALFLMAIIAASISTAAIILMTTGIIISRDIIYILKREATDDQIILWTRLSMVMVVIASLIASLLYREQIGFVMVIASSGLFIWLPLLWLGLLWKGATTWGAIAGIVGGLGYLVAGFIYPPLFVVEIPVIALIVGVVAMVVVSLFTPKVSEETISRFYDEVDEYLELEVRKNLLAGNESRDVEV